MIFHIDANSFYASCERLFRPDLAGKPIVVLSNNDGIVIALNDEAKEKGFRRGDAWFKIAEECDRKGISVFSSNYTLYADMSARLVTIYSRLCPEVEIYSIDECFLYYPDWKCPDFAGIGTHLRNTVLKETGMPVSVGIAPTRTLAKLCNKLAKKRGGVLYWGDLDADRELGNYPAGDVWGIGWSKETLLRRHGIRTAAELRKFPLDLAKRYLTVNGFRTVQELNGIPAIDRIEPARRQNICTSKSFGEPVTDLASLEEALTEYSHEAVSRLREQHSAARFVSVYLMTSPWDEAGPQYFNQLSAALPSPGCYLPDILGTALGLLRRLYREGYRYRKVMVNLLGLEEDTVLQGDLFRTDPARPERRALMDCFDAINSRYGRNTLTLGPFSAGNRGWNMQRRFLSPAYTTDLAGIPEVH